MKVFVIILVVLAAVIIFTSFVYLFVDAKPFKTIIRIANIVYFILFALLLLLANGIGWTAAPIVGLAIIAPLVVVQYAVPQIRKTR